MEQQNTRIEDTTLVKGHDWAIFLATGLSFVASVYLWFSGDKEAGLYIGIWVPSILALGSYMKLTAGGSHGA